LSKNNFVSQAASRRHPRLDHTTRLSPNTIVDKGASVHQLYLVPKFSSASPFISISCLEAKFTMPGLVSATGVLAFLADEEPELKVYALQTLNDDVDTVWTEVAGSLSDM